MASPVLVKLTCPLCGSMFRARTMGSNYYISGIDSDLRETGSIDEVRRYSIASCQVCRYSDYSWDFLAPDELAADTRKKLEDVLEVNASAPGRALNRRLPDFERLHLADECFQARGLDCSSRAELQLLAYYVACDLGRRDLEPGFRNAAADLFCMALEEEELPAPLALRYSYLAGELTRRSGKDEVAIELFDRALAASEEDPEDPEGNAWDIGRMARRQRAAVLYSNAGGQELVELTRGDDPDVASEARRLLATRRDSESVAATSDVWTEATQRERTEMLRELVKDPSLELADLFRDALGSDAPEDIQLASRALALLGDSDYAPAVVAALERGVLSTEYALVDSLRVLGAENSVDEVFQILEAWEKRDSDAGEDTWYFSSDTTPLRYFLYTQGSERGRALLMRDLRGLKENDLWDKIPSGGPVSAALMIGEEIADSLEGLLTDENPAARRWATYCLTRLGRGVSAIGPLVKDPERVVRLQAVAGLAAMGEGANGLADAALAEIRSLDPGDLPFALHFLVPFKSDEVKAFLLDLLNGQKTTSCEVLPLLGRQEPDEEIGEILSMSILATNDETRAGAVTGLAFQGSDQGATLLRLLYDQEDSDEVLRRVIFGLGALAERGTHREGTIEFLRERINKANPRLRFAMALTLLKLDDTTGIDLVRERAALFNESFDRYDLVKPALRALAAYEAKTTA